MLLSFDWIICIFLRCLFYRMVFIVCNLGIGIMDAIGFPGNSTRFEDKRIRWSLAKGFVFLKVCEKMTFIDIWMLFIYIRYIQRRKIEWNYSYLHSQINWVSYLGVWIDVAFDCGRVEIWGYMLKDVSETWMSFWFVLDVVLVFRTIISVWCVVDQLLKLNF